MNDNNGWIKLSKRLIEEEYYFGEKFTRAMCWIDILLMAEWRNERTFYKRGLKVTLKRGQVAISLDELATRWMLSKNTVKSRLLEMQKDGRIDRQTDNVISIISVVNYDKYQNFDMQNDRHIDMQTDTQIDMQNDTQTDLQIDTPILKKENNTKKDNITPYGVYDVQAPSTAQKELDLQLPPTESNQPIKKITTRKKTENSASTPEQVYAQLHTPAKKKSAEFDYEFVVKLYHDRCPSLPKVQNLSEARKQKVKARLQEFKKFYPDVQPYEFLSNLFDRIFSSDFLRGDVARYDGRKSWKADFDWIFRNTDNWMKVIEGKYDNAKNNTDQPKSSQANGNIATNQAGGHSATTNQQPTASERQRMSVLSTLAKIESQDQERESADNIPSFYGLT